MLRAIANLIDLSANRRVAGARTFIEFMAK